MTALFVHADNLLRGHPLEAEASETRRLLILLQLVLVCGVTYGYVMGAFGGVSGERVLQPIYSALKVPLLLLATFALSLPSFFVINTLLGLRDDFPQVLRALVGAQAALTVVLVSLAPLTIFWYAGVPEYNVAILFNAAMFGVATFAAQWLLRRSYRPLIARNRHHRTLLRAWMVIYAFVAVQMAWILRPFIGSPDAPTTFFREGAWGNAYVEVAQIIMRALGQ